jgi:arylsulfate sulfotransferase
MSFQAKRRARTRARTFFAPALLVIVPATVSTCAAMSVSLNPSVPSPAPVGTVVTWTASVSDASPGVLWYRFRSHRTDQPFHVVRDYGPVSTLDWTAANYEGSYEVELSVRNRDTGDSAMTSMIYQMTSRITGNSVVISPTSHPLVSLYSAPPCPTGSRMRVQFHSAGNAVLATPFKQCAGSLSMNFYLAGVQPDQMYSARYLIDTGSGDQPGPATRSDVPGFSSADLGLPQLTVQQPPPDSPADPILLHSSLDGTPIATDLSGNLLWFYPNIISILTRPAPGGLFFGYINDPTADQSGQIVREFDLQGLTVAETNAARINEQLTAMGARQISSFHHEARSLPGGKIVALATVEQILTDVQGPGPVDVLGDMILVMDSDMQVLWTWDAFDHLDTSRQAVLGETCTVTTAGCPPFYLAPQANDWLHGNSVQLTPDGNLLYSSRHQDWVFKIDYNNGNGAGDVIWRLGLGGDFAIDSSDPYPWFSHQHDPEYVPGEAQSTITIFDDGNTRQYLYPDAKSRGQVLQLDEQAFTATILLNADLGVYSTALGSAQQLSNGNYFFDAGILADESALLVEVDPTGNPVYSLKSAGPEYRTFRMRDLYTPPY